MAKVKKQAPDASEGTEEAVMSKALITDDIRATFEKHPHVLTIWVNPDNTIEWYFRSKPGLVAIERNEL